MFGRSWARALAVVSLSLAAFACGGLRYTQTGPAYEPFPANCKFRIFTTAPDAPYEEIGIIDKVGEAGIASKHYDNIEEFRAAIAPHVCQAGGNGAIVFADGYGLYLKATVVVVKPKPKKKPKPPAESTDDAAE